MPAGTMHAQQDAQQFYSARYNSMRQDSSSPNSQQQQQKQQQQQQNAHKAIVNKTNFSIFVFVFVFLHRFDCWFCWFELNRTRLVKRHHTLSSRNNIKPKDIIQTYIVPSLSFVLSEIILLLLDEKQCNHANTAFARRT